jgi:hypothetical protein
MAFILFICRHIFDECITKVQIQNYVTERESAVIVSAIRKIAIYHKVLIIHNHNHAHEIVIVLVTST